jgi:hypothetical protein
MPTVGYEPTISAGERPQIYALDRAATGTGISSLTSSDNGICDKFLTNNFIFIHPIPRFPAVQEQVWGPTACRISSTHRSLLLQSKLAG